MSAIYGEAIPYVEGKADCMEDFLRDDTGSWGTSEILSLPWLHNTTDGRFGGFDHTSNPDAFYSLSWLNGGSGVMSLETDTLTSSDPWAWIEPPGMTSPVELLYRFTITANPWPSADYFDFRIGAQEDFFGGFLVWQGPVLQFTSSPGWDYIEVYPLRPEGSLVTYSQYTISAYQPGTFINARMLINDTGIQGWVWLDGETEPTSPNVEYTGSSVPYNPTLLGAAGISAVDSGLYVFVDSICALQGLSCSNVIPLWVPGDRILSNSWVRRFEGFDSSTSQVHPNFYAMAIGKWLIGHTHVGHGHYTGTIQQSFMQYREPTLTATRARFKPGLTIESQTLNPAIPFSILSTDWGGSGPTGFDPGGSVVFSGTIPAYPGSGSASSLELSGEFDVVGGQCKLYVRMDGVAADPTDPYAYVINELHPIEFLSPRSGAGSCKEPVNYAHVFPPESTAGGIVTS